MKITTPSTVSALLCCLLLSGCATAGMNLNFSSKKHETEAADNPVEQVVPVWQESEGPGIEENQVSRGFNGQIYFITRKRGLPSEVKGNVRIYVFDDQGAADELAKPIHQFDFKPDAWASHLTITKLGPAYSVFVPYTRRGRHKADCSLRIRYMPENGGPVYSQMVTIILAGSKSEALEILDQSSATVIPELSKRSKPASRRVTQVSAKGQLLEQQQVRSAGYETPPRKVRSGSRVARRDRVEDSIDVRHADFGEGDGMVDLPAGEAPAEDLLEQLSHEDVESEDGESYEPQDDADSEDSVRTYTIQLGQ